MSLIAQTRSVCLLDADPELAAGIHEPWTSGLRERLTVPEHELPAGPWSSASELSACLAVLVTEGLLVRDTVASGRPHLHVYGPGDLVDGRDLDGRSEWTALERARLAVLGPRISFAAREHPALVRAFARRFFDGQRERDAMLTIRALPAAEERLAALFEHFARRWGRVTRDGLVVRLPLTHGMLGRLIGAQRPTVSLALRELLDTARLERLEDGRWRLPPGTADALALAASA